MNNGNYKYVTRVFGAENVIFGSLYPFQCTNKQFLSEMFTVVVIGRA